MKSHENTYQQNSRELCAEVEIRTHDTRVSWWQALLASEPLTVLLVSSACRYWPATKPTTIAINQSQILSCWMLIGFRNLFKNGQSGALVWSHPGSSGYKAGWYCSNKPENEAEKKNLPANSLLCGEAARHKGYRSPRDHSWRKIRGTEPDEIWCRHPSGNTKEVLLSTAQEILGRQGNKDWIPRLCLGEWEDVCWILCIHPFVQLCYENFEFSLGICPHARNTSGTCTRSLVPTKIYCWGLKTWLPCCLVSLRPRWWGLGADWTLEVKVDKNV